MLRIAREKKQPQILESVGAQNDSSRFLEAALSLGIQVFGSIGSAVLIRSDPNDPAMSPQIKIAGGQCFRDRGERRVPFIAVVGTKPIAPSAIGGGRAAPIGYRIHSDGDRMGVQ